MICCVLVARAGETYFKGSSLADGRRLGELGQNYLVDKVNGLRVRRLSTAADANRFIDSAIQELTLSGSDFCRCASPTPATEATPATERRLRWQDYLPRRK